jgi:hypothetical protein
MGQSFSTPGLQQICLFYLREVVTDLVQFYVGYCRFSFHMNKTLAARGLEELFSSIENSLPKFVTLQNCKQFLCSSLC